MRITIDLSDSELEQVKRFAEQRGMTLDQLARTLLLKEMQIPSRSGQPVLEESATEAEEWQVEFVPVGENAFRMRILQAGMEIQPDPRAGVGSLHSGMGDLSIRHDEYFVEASSQ